MMTTDTGVSVMVMYQDESVYVRYLDGSTLNVAPCGSEFLVVRAPDPPAHPLQATRHVRQRTRFAISTYKVLIEYLVIIMIIIIIIIIIIISLILITKAVCYRCI